MCAMSGAHETRTEEPDAGESDVPHATVMVYTIDMRLSLVSLFSTSTGCQGGA